MLRFSDLEHGDVFEFLGYSAEYVKFSDTQYVSIDRNDGEIWTNVDLDTPVTLNR